MKLPKGQAGAGTRIDVEIRIADEPFIVDLRLLSAGEEAEALVDAYAYAKARGISDPSEADAIYETGLIFAIISRSATDHDSPKDAPVRLFAGIDDLAAEPLITGEHLAYLKARYDTMVDEKSPRSLVITTEHFVEIRRRSADGDPLPFSALRRGAQWSCFRTMAVLCENLLAENLRLSAPSSKTTTEPTPPPATEH